MMQCVSAGHQIVALANLQPIEKGMVLSYLMYHIVRNIWLLRLYILFRCYHFHVMLAQCNKE